MRFELFIALRYLCARSRETFITFISVLSVLGVGLGVAALVIVMGVYNGFTTDIRDKIIGANAHIVVTGNVFHHDGKVRQLDEVLRIVDGVPGVTGATPFLYAEGMLSSPRGVKGVIMRGVDPVSSPNVISMLKDLQEGSVNGLASTDGAPGVIVGVELAKRLGLQVGSRVNLLSPAGQKSATGFQPRIRPYTVVGIFRSGMFEYDSSLAYTSLPAGRELMGLADDAISGIEVTVKDVYAADKVAAEIGKALGPAVFVRHWKEMNANLFAALELEKIGMFIVLTMVVLVGSFSIVTTLVMLVMEKTRDIAVLMSLGATRGMIRRIFMLQGTLIGLAGTLLGYATGIPLGMALQEYQFIQLPPGVYTIDHLPVLLRAEDILIVGGAAMLLCFIATIYPARQAARLEPAEALRYE